MTAPLPPDSVDLRTCMDRHAGLAGHPADFAEAVLRDAILAGVYIPGAPIEPDEAAAALGIEPSAVRRALRLLEDESLVAFVPFRGAVVARIRFLDVLDNFTIREALEPMAFGLSIPHLTADDFARARGLIDRMADETVPRRMIQLNKQFHSVLYSRADRPRMLALIEEQLDGFDMFVRYHLTSMGRATMPQAEHVTLVELAEARDVAGGCALARQHVVTALGTVRRFFAENPAFGLDPEPAERIARTA